MYFSFLLRFWQQFDGEDNNKREPVWKIELEHIQTQERFSFHSEEELSQFLKERFREADSKGIHNRKEER